jgi:hypothetical protein
LKEDGAAGQTKKLSWAALFQFCECCGHKMEIAFSADNILEIHFKPNDMRKVRQWIAQD